MPGIPIEPDLISECENLNEVSPVTMDTLVDTEQAIDLAETSGTDIDESCTYDEAEVEAVEEELHEVEPADEDQMEDIEPPTVEIIGPDSTDDSDNEDNDEEGNDDNNNLNMESNENDSLNNNSSAEDGAEINAGDNLDKNNFDEQDNSNETPADGQIEDVIDRLKVDFVSDSDTNSDKKENGETFHDALDGNKIANVNLGSTELTEDPGGQASDSDSKTIGTDNENETDSDNKPADDNKEKSNNNIELDKDLDMVQKQKGHVSIGEPVNEIPVDETVTGLGDSSTDQV